MKGPCLVGPPCSRGGGCSSLLLTRGLLFSEWDRCQFATPKPADFLLCPLAAGDIVPRGTPRASPVVLEARVAWRNISLTLESFDTAHGLLRLAEKPAPQPTLFSFSPRKHHQKHRVICEAGLSASSFPFSLYPFFFFVVIARRRRLV